MGRPVILSNGKLLVGLNENGLVHDFYYPYVGLENLTTARSAHHNLGVWVDGVFSWLDSGDWQINVNMEDDALVSSIRAKHKSLPVELVFNDFVDHQYTAFCRDISVTNTSDKEIEVRLMLHQVFEISRYGRGDTALYVPSGNYILDYKGWYSLLIYAEDEQGQPFDQFSVGNHGIEGKEGTFRDAEDGELSGNLVEHGSVDSAIRCRKSLPAGSSHRFSYWIIAADSQFDAEIIHHVMRNQNITARLAQTKDYWRDWLAIGSASLASFDEKYHAAAKKSLMIIKSHCDSHGGIIASCDSSIYNYGRDYYSYVWPRDGALTLLPLIHMGYKEEALNFFKFCADTIHPRGFMMHKYQPDKAIGSTWHPLMHKHHPELAIQEDETAAVVYALGVFFEKTNNSAEIQPFYKNLIKPACDFMTSFIDQTTGLPHASYDLWEEKFGTHTYTVALTIAALKEGAKIAQALSMNQDHDNWLRAVAGIVSHLDALYSEQLGYYRKSQLLQESGQLEYDETIDCSSFHALSSFGTDWSDKSRVRSTVEAVEAKLSDRTPVGGTPRYENDYYFKTRSDSLGNPWFVCSLWLAQYYFSNGRRDDGLKIVDWSLEHSNSSGLMSEQVDPDSGSQIGVSPLIWSHAELLNGLLASAKAA